MHLLTAWPAIRFPIFMYQVDLILSDFFLVAGGIGGTVVMERAPPESDQGFGY